MENAIKVYKGTNPEVDSYSVFWDNKKLSDTSLCAQLKQKGITDIYVCGLAYDVCVGQYLHGVQATCERASNNIGIIMLFCFVRRHCSGLVVSRLSNNLDWRLLSRSRRPRHRSDQGRHPGKSRRDCSVQRGMMMYSRPVRDFSHRPSTSHKNHKPRAGNICCFPPFHRQPRL